MTVRVAAGVLRRPDGRVLINQRPAGKIAAGRWEFPGGKIEAGESAEHALQRELREELGITATRLRPLIRIRHAYTERTVELDTWLVEAWAGEPRGVEGQALAWVEPERIWDYDLLEADAPIVTALRLPVQLPVTGSFEDSDELCARCLGLARQGHSLIRLRAPQLDDASYTACVKQLGPVMAERGGGLLVDRASIPMDWPGVSGLHLPARQLQGLSGRPVPSECWWLASCHDAREIGWAHRSDVDAIVLGAVLATPSHPGRPALGWSGFAGLVQQANIPAYAIGGLGPADMARAFAQGAQGIAAISAYW